MGPSLKYRFVNSSYEKIAYATSVVLEGSEELTVARSVKPWLNSKYSGSWLLILDNLEDTRPDILSHLRRTLPIKRVLSWSQPAIQSY